MAIISFEEFSKIANKKQPQQPLKNVKRVDETAFVVGDTYKVKIVADVPKNLVDEYIQKVKDETGKNP